MDARGRRVVGTLRRGRAAYQLVGSFGRICTWPTAAFIAALSLAWGVLAEGFRPDRYDLLGTLVVVCGVLLRVALLQLRKGRSRKEKHMQERNDKGEPVLACDFTAMDTEQRERYRALRRRLSQDLHEARDLKDGYAFRHASEAEVLIELAEYVTLERLCCPFFDFAIEVGRDGGEVWLRITGGQEAKRILQAAQAVT